MASRRSTFITKERIVKAAGWGFAAFLLFIVYFGYDLPGTDDVKPLDLNPSITVLASDGSVLARYGGIKGNYVKIADLPPYVPHAVIAIEDRRFYQHFGIDPIGLARAMGANLLARHWVQGGSTITQQLAKNLFLTPDKNIRRKVQEALLAFQIERRYTKDEILAAYLNRVYFGAGAYGIDAAARVYFSKHAKDLTLWEGAVLAGLLKAPSRFSPSANPDLAEKRAKVVLAAMEDAGFLTEKQMKREMTNVARGIDKNGDDNQDRYFTDWVINQIDSFVSNNDRDLIVRTTLDSRLQRLLDQNQKAFFNNVKPEEKVTQAAIVTMSRGGAVLAMLGGKDYNDSQFNRATQALRQPGSSFKPFVYLAALEAGLTPDMQVDSSKITEGSYRPDNYEGQSYGIVTLTDALALSLNTATVRVLQEIGMPRFMSVLSRFSFPQNFRPELATGLGAGETTVLDMTAAYAEIANGGHAVTPYAVLSVKDSAGNVLYAVDPADHPQVFRTADISALDSMMVQVVARGTGQAAQLGRGHVAGKTGTSQNYRDAWFIGYTDRLITGVWMGNDDDTPMNKVTGGRYPARFWRDYMQGAIGVDLADFAAAPVSGGYAVPTGNGAPAQPVSSSGGGFFDMLQSWSAPAPDSAPVQPARQVRPSNVPVYNQ